MKLNSSSKVGVALIKKLVITFQSISSLILFSTTPRTAMALFPHTSIFKTSYKVYTVASFAIAHFYGVIPRIWCRYLNHPGFSRLHTPLNFMASSRAYEGVIPTISGFHDIIHGLWCFYISKSLFSPLHMPRVKFI